jgi:YcaO-like protein with predicted kinase domain
MTGELRCRALPDTLKLAVAAAARAGVTRVSDVTAFAVPGIPVFQATRPAARSLAVSQGKGLTATAAIVGALLETVELWSAECLAQPEASRPLADLAESDIATWSGPRGELAIQVDPAPARAWLPGEDLLSGRACPVPWDLLSLDCTLDKLGCRATSVGLACGNTRTESLVSGLAEALEHHSMVLFDRLAPRERLTGQIALSTIDDPAIRQLLRRIEAAGFQPKAWSMANEAGLPAILCTLFRSELCLDAIAPAGGSGCHPVREVAFQRALLEAVQSRAGLVAGARDDLQVEDYGTGREREAAIVFGSLAFGDGLLDWRDVPTADCTSSERALEFLLAKAEELGNLPVVAFDHEPPCPGLHLAHVLAPGLLVRERRRSFETGSQPPSAGWQSQPLRTGFDKLTASIPPQDEREGEFQGERAKYGRLLNSRRSGRSSQRKLLFAGPSIAGLAIPEGIEVRPPARCGDLAALLDDPPGAVGLVDGVFKMAPTVWHKEIMSLLALGTRVIGGASLGALRAAELERFGMEGVGAIFHAYRGGVLVRDDAVMLIHAPAELGYAPLSVPLVDAEYALSLADLPKAARRMMQRIVRRAPFETRNWPDCLAEYAMRTGEEFPLPAELLEAAGSLKRSDAQLVIEALAAEGLAEAPAERWPMPPLTDDYRALLARTAPAFAASPA